LGSYPDVRRDLVQQRLYAISVPVVIQAFCPAQTSVSVDRKVARNHLLHIASTVVCKARNRESSTFGFWLTLNATQQKPKELDGKRKKKEIKMRYNCKPWIQKRKEKKILIPIDLYFN
jgi:hypothetical protein